MSTGPSNDNPIIRSLTEVFSNLINNIDNSFLDDLRNSGEIEEYYERIINAPEILRDSAIRNFSRTRYSDILNLYSPDERELATNHIKDLRDSYFVDVDADIGDYGEYEVSREIINKTLELYYENGAHSFPDLEDIVNSLFENRCNCVRSYPENYVKKVIKQCVVYTGILPSCSLYPQYVEFYILHGKIPSRDELEEYMRRIYEFSRNPEEFHQTDKCLVPTLNVDNLPRHSFSEDEENTGCGVCQDEFINGQILITLLPCGHKFHENKKDCLETTCILNWLETHNVCPLCKSHIG
jgi:hypothetical protein